MRNASMGVGCLFALSIIACDGRGSGGDGGPALHDGSVAPDAAASDAGPTPDGGPGADGGSGIDGGSDGDAGSDAGGPACTPTDGAAMADAYCDSVSLALMDNGSGPVEARLSARVSPNGLADDGCAIVDSIEVIEGGETIGTFEGSGELDHTSNSSLLASADALPEMADRCGSDEGRFGGFGFVVRGRMDGGTFEARCADAESGTRWPPALVISCHENVDEPPDALDSEVRITSSYTNTSFGLLMTHRPGGALTTVNGSAHVITAVAPHSGAPTPEPLDISGLSGSASEASSPSYGDYSSLRLSVLGDPLGSERCPLPWSGEPEFDPYPVMLVRVTGSGERGAWSTEGLFAYCARVVMATGGGAP